MRTGYDSFWMYQNNRQEPVSHLPKNDNHSCAVLTDSYKQVQSRGHPSHLNFYIQPQYDGASSHQNDQRRLSGSQYIWPSTVYSVPLKPSYVSEYHTQEAFSTQSNNLIHSSQTQQNYGVRHIKNPNVSVSQVYNKNSNHNNHDSRNNESSKTLKIRVRDVFSLNHNTIPNTIQNQKLNSSLHPTHPQKQHEYGLKYGAVNYSRSNSSEAQSELVNYGKEHLPQANPPITLLYYGFRRREPEECLQNSDSFYHQNAEFPSGNQLQFGSSRSTERNLHPEASKTNTSASVLKQGPSCGNSQDAGLWNNRSSCDTLHGNRRVKIIPKRNSVLINIPEFSNNLAYTGSLDVNKALTHETSNISNVTQIQNQQQENVTRIDETSLLRSNSSAITPTSRSPLNRRISEQGNTILKISIPHIGQTTLLNLSDSSSTSKSSDLSLPCLLESSDKFYNKKSPNHNHNGTKESTIVNSQLPKTGEVSLDNFQTTSGMDYVSNSSLSPAKNPGSVGQKNLGVPPRKRMCTTEPFLKLNKENLHEFLSSTFENTPGSLNSRSGNREKNISKNTIFDNDNTLNALGLEQGVQSRSESRDDNISEKKLFEIIKTEENPLADENSEDFAVKTEERNTFGNSSTDEGADKIALDKVDAENFVFDSEKQDPKANQKAENSIQTGENSIINSNTDGNKPGTESGQEEETVKEFDAGKNHYKSKINRDKLDMLIQFLEKDDDRVGTRLKPSTRKKICVNNKRNREVGLNHSRRKLSKTCIVRNKNNSREMISMMSHKIARVELFKCSSQTPQTVKSNTNSSNTNSSNTNSENCGDKKSTEVTLKAGQSVSICEKQMKCDPTRNNQTEINDSSKSETKNVNGAKESREISNDHSTERNCLIQAEWNVISKLRTFQNLKSHLCTGCDLLLSVDSFWINIVSGELRCLNCFLKNAVKSEENAHKTNGVNSSRGKTDRKDITEKTTENNPESTLEPRDGNNLEHIDGPKDDANSVIANEADESPCKQEPMETVESPENYYERNHASEHAKRETMEFPKPLRRRSGSAEDKSSAKGKTAEEQRKVNKLKDESIGHKTKASEDSSKLERKQIHGKPKGKDSFSNENCSMTKSPTHNNAKSFPDTLEKSEKRSISKEGSNNLKTVVCNVENIRKEQPWDHSLRKTITKEYNITEEDVENKLEKSVRKILSEEEEMAGEHAESEKKGLDPSSQGRKRSDSKDFGSYKSLELEELAKKDAKRDWLDKSVRKAKADYSCYKNNIAEKTTKKSTKYDQIEKPKTQTKEGSNCNKPKISDRSKAKELNPPVESEAKSTVSEKHKRESVQQPRKRKCSDEDPVAVKIRVVEDNAKRDVKPEKINTTSVSKQYSEKHKSKMLDCFRRNSLSKEGEHSKKEPKLVVDWSDSSKARDITKGDSAYQKVKSCDQKESDSINMLRRKSKEDHAGYNRNEQTKQTVEAPDEQGSKITSTEDFGSHRTEVQELLEKEVKHWNSATENKVRKKTEEKERKHFPGKTPEGGEKDNHEVVLTSRKVERPKRETASKPLKENQNTKMGGRTTAASGQFTDWHESRREPKKNSEDQSEGKRLTKKLGEKEAVERQANVRGDVESNCYKKKFSDGKCDKRQTENRHARVSDKAVECPKGEDIMALKEIRESGKRSDTLLVKLIKKTKKFSWSLLGEA